MGERAFRSRQQIEGKWTFLKKIDGGHKFFKLIQDPSKIGVADDSGDTPDDTDDGPLFLDRERAISAGRHGDRWFVSIPLLWEDGTPSDTPCGFEEALWVASQFGLSIRFRDQFYTIIKQELV